MDKILIVSLDDDVFTHISYNATLEAVKNNRELIITPILQFFSYYYVSKGYRVYAKNKDIEICLNDLLDNGMVRPAQNATSMLLSNVFADLGLKIED